MTDRVQTNGASADIDTIETSEWLEALDAVLTHDGPERAQDLLVRGDRARAACGRGADRQPQHPVREHDSRPSGRRELPGDPALERRPALDRALERDRDGRARQQGRPPSSAGTSRPTSRRRRSTRSASTTSGTRRANDHGGDLVYFQGHSSPGNYARAYLEGRLTRGAARRLPPRGQPRRARVVSASVADARLLAVPDGLAGDRRRSPRSTRRAS